TSCMLTRDRKDDIKVLFQLLLYPWLDGRNTSESYRKYTDTPMWSSSLSESVGPLLAPDIDSLPLMFTSPVEADSFEGLPPAYIEVAEFDPLHDDGVYYAQLLNEASIPVVLHETKNTMHGFDAKINAPTTQAMLKKRIDFMNGMFAQNKKAAYL
ncbi:MAG: alpha/beta hydrolase fold domain-containing protein, partial [Eggerthellaceae bacterium]|nr:alpha/beta hydrolase fold domain-containing protein [Eggerthellaceae bacterium]